MRTYKPIYTVLPVTGLADAGLSIDDLMAESIGTMGLFKKGSTGSWITIDSISSAAKGDDLFIGVVGKNGVILKSAGEYFRKDWLTTAAYQPKEEAVPMLFYPTLASGATLQGVEGIRIEFINAETLMTTGYNQNMKFYSIAPNCVDPCTNPCDTTYTNVDLYKAIVPSMLLDPDQLFYIYSVSGLGDLTANAIAAIPTAQDKVDAILTALDAAQSTVTIVFAVNSANMYDYCKVNLKYAYPRQTTVTVTMAQTCKQIIVYDNANAANLTKLNSALGESSNLPQMKYEQGNGYDIKQMEFEASRWSGRLEFTHFSEFTFTENGYDYQVDPSKKYNMLTVNRANEGNEGQMTYTDAMMDLFVSEDAAVLSSINTMLGLGLTIATEDPQPEDPQPEDPQPEDPQPEVPEPEDPETNP